MSTAVVFDQAWLIIAVQTVGSLAVHDGTLLMFFPYRTRR